jgi:hypothetical protein
MIKQQSVVLAALPVIYVLIGRRWELLRRRDFWIAAIPPVIIAGPWYVLTTGFFYKDLVDWSGFAGQGAAAASYEWSVWWSLAGVAIALLSVAGVALALRRPDRSAALLWSSILLSTFASSALLRAMGEPRHLLLGLAAQVALAALVLSSLRPALKPWAALAVVVLNFGWASPPHQGYTDAAAIIESGPPGHVLLSGWGDGAIIAAAAARHPAADGHRYWLRANKLMGDVRWSGEINRRYFGSTGEVTEMLVGTGINQVYLDYSGAPSPFTLLLEQAISESAGSWEAVRLPTAGNAKLFKRREPLPLKPVSFFLPRLRRAIGGY